MKLLFTSDLHGSESQYERLIALAQTESPDVIVLGGDMLPDDSTMDAKSLGKGQPQFVASAFKNFVQRMKQAGACDQVLVIFGNHDWASCVPAMQQLETDSVVTMLNLDRVVTVNGLNFVGYWHTPPTPFFVKDFERLDMPGDEPPLMGGARWDTNFRRMKQQGGRTIFEGYPTMKEELDGFSPPAAPWVWVAHTPPFGSKLDQANGNHSWGSKAVRHAIEKYQPMLSLHGHIHDSPEVSGEYSETIGATLAINPGQLERSLCFAAIEIDAASQSITNVRRGRQS